MSNPTHDSQNIDVQALREAHSSTKRLPFRGRRFFLWGSGIAIVFVLAVTLLLVWQSRSPQLSFLILKFGLLTRVNIVTGSVADENQLDSALSEQILPILLTESFSRPDEALSDADRAKQQVMIQTIRAVLPNVLKSFRHVKDVSSSTGTGSATNDYVLKNFLPMALRIQPDVWSQWWTEFTAGHFHMSTCRFSPDHERAACELIILGPLKQSATLALLWEKKDWLWHLQGLDGIDRLLAAMRATAKLPE